ncbi:MAG TPA: DUF1801 domain-containing protein [Candidatus Dormibacteraeota bacterium]
MTVDEFVEAKVAPEFRPVVAAIRGLMKECAPDAEEVISYGMPVYKGKTLFAWINPPKKDVTLSFTRGDKLEDKYDLLRGDAKGGARHAKMKNLEDVNKPALKYYIKQAVSLDKR